MTRGIPGTITHRPTTTRARLEQGQATRAREQAERERKAGNVAERRWLGRPRAWYGIRSGEWRTVRWIA